MENKYKKSQLIVLAGATAVGKTGLSLQLAQSLNCEIISADSRQLYREMSIGTAKPNAEELAQVRHHFINSHSITEDYNVGQYEQEALATLDKIFQKNPFAIAVGGSGLYLKALCEGIDPMPDIPPEIRQNLRTRYEQEGLEPLLAELAQLDPQYFEEVDRANPQRILRALEVCQSSGKPFSSFRLNNQEKSRPFEMVKFVIDRPRESLYERINQRVEMMIAEGLEQEARSLYPYRAHNALQTVGYQEIFDYMEGKHDWEEAQRLIKRNSRRYAKRQLTWLRKQEGFEWLEAESALEMIEKKLTNP